MRTILQLDTSLFSNHGESSQLAARLVDGLRDSNPNVRVIHRDLVADPVPHLDADRFQAFLTEADERDIDQQAVAGLSDGLIDELQRADTLVIGLPMYNFGVPSQLKAYFDHIARAGVTFRYADEGPVGLLTGKKAYVLAARGGRYAGTALDSQTDYVRNFLAFLGISDVDFVYAEGLAMGGDTRGEALAEAHRAIDELIQQSQPAAAA